MHATARGVLGNKPASGTEIIQELGEEHQKTGKWIVYTSADSVFQIAAHEETIPLEELYEGCKKAREILTGKHAVGRVIARPFIGEPGNYERTPNRHDFSLEPRRPNYLTQVREAGAEVHGVGKIPDIFAHLDMDHEHPTKSNVEGITVTEQLLGDIDSGLVFTNLVETDMLWGHRNDPENFHRCLQDFDRRLPDLLEALREGDLLIVTSDHGIDPTTASTDHSREYGLLLAYVQGKNAAGHIHEGEFGDVGATVNAWLGGKAAPKRLSGRRFSSLETAQRPGACPTGVRGRKTVWSRAHRSTRASPARMRGRRRFRRSEVLRATCWRSDAAGASSRSGCWSSSAWTWSPSTCRHGWSSWRASVGSTRVSATWKPCPSRMSRSTSPWPTGCSTTFPISSRRSPSSPASRGRVAGWWRRRTASTTWASCGRSSVEIGTGSPSASSAKTPRRL